MRKRTKNGDTEIADELTVSLGDGSRIDKTSLRFEAASALAELNSAIGLAISMSDSRDVIACLKDIQRDINNLESQIMKPGIQWIPEERANNVTRLLKEFSDKVRSQEIPVLPGGTPAASSMYMAQAICRRAGIVLIKLMNEEVRLVEMGLAPESQCSHSHAPKYMSRLWELLYALAEFENSLVGRNPSC